MARSAEGFLEVLNALYILWRADEHGLWQFKRERNHIGSACELFGSVSSDRNSVGGGEIPATAVYPYDNVAPCKIHPETDEFRE